MNQFPKKINEDPATNDQILFEFKNKPSSVKIFFLEKSICNKNQFYETKYNQPNFNTFKLDKQNLENAQSKIEEQCIKCKSFLSNTEMVHYTEEADKQYIWDSKGQLPGDYIVEYIVEWEDGDKKEHFCFHLKHGSEFPKAYHKDYDTIGKYELLFNRYTPQMFKYFITPGDRTISILEVLQQAIARSFAYVEDSLNELAYVYDANTSNELLLGLLADFFGKKLKGNESHLWRSQVKGAMKTLKQKGTKTGLEEALLQIGIKLKKVTKLWQVMPLFTWTDSFKVQFDGQSTFTLTKNPLKDYKIYLKSLNRKDYIELDSSTITFVDSIEESGKVLMIWKNQEISLFTNDFLRITYLYKEISPDKQTLEDYINNLPLADDRDSCENKNWNLRLIEEDDPLFDSIIPERYPFYDPIVYGKVRTTFLYSENIYNMDTFNGSVRNSYMPCDIDKDFIDTCSYGQSSKVNLDLEVQEMSDLNQIKEVLEENLPFHTRVHEMNLHITKKDIIVGPIEQIKIERNEDHNKESLACREKIFCKIEYDDGRIESLEI